MKTLRKLIAWDRWANEALLEFAADQLMPPEAKRLLDHIVGAEILWLARIDGSAGEAAWPEYDSLSAGDALRTAHERWSALLSTGRSVDLESEVRYTNSKGEAFRSTIEEIMMHVVTHSAYHRGQIASRLRAAGLTPPYTDFIHAARNGFLRDA